MQDERWRRVEELYYAAAEQAEDQRAAFLDRSCADQPDLRREVESLLAYARRTGQFIDKPAMQVVAASLAEEIPLDRSDGDPDRLIGKRVGQYRIVAKLASGGMGDVFRAIRADEAYEQDVALKLMRAGQGFGCFLDRFRNERRILATLEHPNITRLLDGGTTNEGTPYFVMELVEGLPVDLYCDRHHLSIDERLRLFMQVCSAVQYAHQRLIIHRDIKPENVLVTAEGVPKLMDFGIAKILNADDEGSQNATITALRAFTPGYASPEQIKGEPITTASDVYSLGVVLYELLTGRSPYRVTKQNPHEMARAICEVEPQKPSTAVAQARHSATPSAADMPHDVSPEKLRRYLRGDLDNIVLMALRKEPQRRYASVEQFREDLRRHLESLPVMAQNDTLAYRTSKFIQRHRAGVAIAVAISILLFAALGVSLHEARVARVQQMRAQQRFNDVRELANSLMFDVHDSIKDLAGATPARKLLVTKALQYLEKLSQDAAGDASLQRELAAAYEKIGNVQGNPDSANLGDISGAIASYRKSLALRSALAARPAAAVEDQVALASSYERLSEILVSSGDYSGALDSAREAYVITEKLASQKKDDPLLQEGWAGASFDLAHCLKLTGNLDGAVEYYAKSAFVREAIASGPPRFQEYVRIRLAGSYGYMSGVKQSQGDLDRAIVLQTKAHDILAQLLTADPQNATIREFYSQSTYRLGNYLAEKGSSDQALAQYRAALKDYQALVSADPRDALAADLLGACYREIGSILVSQDRATLGIADIRTALEVHQSLLGTDSAPVVSESLASDDSAMGAAYFHLANRPGISKTESIADWREARSWFEKSLSIKLSDVHERDNVAKELAKCGAALAKLKAPATPE